MKKRDEDQPARGKGNVISRLGKNSHKEGAPANNGKPSRAYKAQGGDAQRGLKPFQKFIKPESNSDRKEKAATKRPYRSDDRQQEGGHSDSKLNEIANRLMAMDKQQDRREYRGDRPNFQDRREGRGDRPNFQDRREGRGDRPNFQDRREGRGDRPNFQDRREDRGDRPNFQDRREDRGDRPNFQDRREYRGDRPNFQDRREDRGDRPNFQDRREGRGDRPNFQDRREGRGDRPNFQDRREDRGDRPNFQDRREYRGDRPNFQDRREGRGDRPNFQDRREYRGDRPAVYEKRVGRGPATPPESNSIEVRLNRYIANAGICSRREADELISKGEVTVNGKVVTEMGYKVHPNDKVNYQGKMLQREKFVYVLLNKPKGFITTTKDPKDRKTVMALVEKACQERIYPVGRLDRNTTGLLLFTNDGDFAKKIAHPSSNIHKVYYVVLDKPLSLEHEATIRQRELVLEDGPVELDGFSVFSHDRKEIGVELHSGRNRIVRRIFEHFGYTVEKLDRTMLANLTKKDLPRGNWRYLSDQELINLRHFSGNSQ